jgi:periplasmic copper chaperone A
MKMRMLALALAIAACAAPAGAHDYKAQGLLIDHPWARATPQGTTVGAGYLTVRNRGKTADRLLSAATPVAGKVEIHQMTVKDGVMTMRPVEGGIPIAPGKSVELKPGGYHLMLMDLKALLKAGENVPGSVVFEKAGKVDVEFVVEPIGAKEPSGHSR